MGDRHWLTPVSKTPECPRRLKSVDCQVVGPLLHEYPSEVEQVGPRIGLFHAAAELVRQGRLADRPWRIRLLHCPRLEAGSHAVYGRSWRPATLSTLVSVMSESASPCLSGDGKTRPLPSSKARARGDVGLTAQRYSMLAPAFMRSPGIVHVADSRSHVAALASPERAAVRTRNRRHSLDAGLAFDASTVSSAAPSSR